MEVTEPKVFLIGETRFIESGVQAYLNEIGATDWYSHNEEGDMRTLSPSEILTEIMSRTCYNSFKPGLNPNVTKICEGNQKHLANIIDVGHGSVLEHAVLNFVFVDVSRVFTHELVRHRAGVAISQQSMHYVRLQNLKAWIPSCFKNTRMQQKMMKVFEDLEEVQVELAVMTSISREKDFKKKKVLTSAFRRMAPIGVATTIGWSCNFRALRFILEQRTDPTAEEEIRLVFDKVYEIVKHRYPNMLQGYNEEIVDGYIHLTPKKLRKV